MRQSGTKKLTDMAILTAIALILFVVEAQIPTFVAIPGLKLGLANIVTLFAVYHLGCRRAGLVLLARVLLGSIFTGQALALLYSVSGAALCWIVMCIFSKLLPRRQLWAVSIFGAVAHNVGQLCAAMIVMRTLTILWYAPALFVSAILTGAFTGIAAQYTLAALYKHGGRDKN